MAALTPLPALPASSTDATGALLSGLFAGTLHRDPVADGPREGRVRRWRYVAAGDEHAMVGVAVVDLGFVGVAFAFAAAAGRVAQAQSRRPLARGVHVGSTPGAGAACRTRRAAIDIDGAGGFRLDLPASGGRLRAEVEVARPVVDATLLTPTPEGGWNATVKAAGAPVHGHVRIGDGPQVALGPHAGAWSDWTAGRQDRVTTWRWGAGAGVAADGRRVGVNVSTGMNGAGAGEDVVWWDGVPHALPLERLGPTGDDTEGAWHLAGGATDLRLAPRAARRAHEQLPLLTSSYVQPFGVWRGALVDPTGAAADVTLAGVAEDHLAVW